MKSNRNNNYKNEYIWRLIAIMISLNYEKYHLGLIKHTNKSIELKLVKRNLITKNNILQFKKELLEKKYQELRNVNYNVWIYKDKFCNDIWTFSLEHDFNHFFNRHPELLEISNIRKCRCQYATINNEDVHEMDKHNGDIILQLKNEINVLKNHIILIQNRSVERDLENYKSTLHNLQLFSEEVLDLIRLVTRLDNSSNIYNTNQGTNTHIEGFVSAKKMLQKPNIDNCITTKKSYKSRSNIKFGKFTMKKHSNISLKFESNKKNSK